MSLFKAREWWSTRLGNDEEFDLGCLCICNIDNEGEGDPKLCVGSFSGMLRVLYPRQREYQVDDLLLETDLGFPILQIRTGRLTTANPGSQSLAVLHPKKVVVYTVASSGAQVAGGASYWSMNKVYEHEFERTACNMLIGAFGGGRDKDYICVQSMDGQLAFYEQDSAAFSRFLPNFLLPGPLCYLPRQDCIITASSSMEVDAYRYRTLAASNAVTKPEESTSHGAAVKDDKKKGDKKRLQVDWSFNIGETIVDIKVARLSATAGVGEAEVAVLAERSIYILNESGQCVMQKRLDFFASALCTYPTSSGVSNIIIATHSSTLMFYKSLSLIWAATLSFVPVSVFVDSFGKIAGMIALLDDSGFLSVQYLGTDPPTTGVGAVDLSKEPNYEEMDEEHRRLLNIIREATSDSRIEPADRIVLRAQMPTTLDTSSEELRTGMETQAGAGTVTARVFVNYKGSDTIEKVVLTVSVPPPFAVSQDLIVLPSLTGNAQTPVIIPLTFRVTTREMISSRIATVVATYTSAFGEPRSASTELVLPLALVCRVVAPLKNATHKLTLDCSHLPPPLSLLFEDLLSLQTGFNPEQSSAASHILTFMMHNGLDVTILVSKNAGRIRLQSGKFEAMWVILHDLTERLKLYFRSTSESHEDTFTISYTEPIPFPEVFGWIDQHLELRQSITQTAQSLASLAHQFRSIQKRLLLRYKDKNPAPLNHLDSLLEDTYRQLRRVGESMEEKQRQLHEVQLHLSAAISILNLTIRYKFEMDDEAFSVLESHISPNVFECHEQGWEEVTDASVTYLLRSVLAKGGKDVGAIPHSMQPLVDASKLKKHIQLLCDRLAKGVKLTRLPDKKKKDEEEAGTAAAAAAAE